MGKENLAEKPESPFKRRVNWIKASLNAGIIACNWLKSVTWNWIDKCQLASQREDWRQTGNCERFRGRWEGGC